MSLSELEILYKIVCYELSKFPDIFDQDFFYALEVMHGLGNSYGFVIHSLVFQFPYDANLKNDKYRTKMECWILEYLQSKNVGIHNVYIKHRNI